MNLKINFAVCHHFFAVCHGKAHGKAAILCRVPVHVAHGKGGIVCRVPRTGHTTKGLCLPCAKPLRHTANRLFNGVTPVHFILPWAQ